MLMDVNSLILISVVTVAELSAVGIGYWMGKNALIIRDGQVQPRAKVINLKKVAPTITEDPYEKAMRLPGTGRIKTMDEGEK